MISKSRSSKNSYAHKRRKLKRQSQHKKLDRTKNIYSTSLYIYTQSITERRSHDSERIAILANGRCFFGHSAKGLRSCHSLNLLRRNKLILREATVGGLPLLKVLKNMTNHLFLAWCSVLQELHHKQSFMMEASFSAECLQDEDIARK
jgi:hypothetical protein